MAETEISYEFIQEAARHPGVVAHLGVVAERIKRRAEQLADSEEVEMEVATEAGIRPGGRPFVNVVADNAEQEYGSARMRRLRILGRAGEAG
ncbi:hypothetical protein SEA_AOKA_11 [Arthrobacter phage Aoka]|nr:hypothetical protein SEA_AOKA_11 [Arthrobacter phage Aoka]